MASIGQLLISGQGAKSRREIELAQENERARREKAAIGGGWGRALGFGGSFLATMGMTNPITAAILTGMGALAGRSAGRALGGGLERDADKSLDTDFYQGAQRDFKKDIGNYQQGMRNRMLMDTGRDIFSAYNLGKYMEPDATAVADKMGLETMKQPNPNIIPEPTQLSASGAVSSPIDDSLLNLVDPSGITPPAVIQQSQRLGLPVGTTAPYNVAPVTSGMNTNLIGGMNPDQQYDVTNYMRGRYGVDPNINPATGEPW